MKKVREMDQEKSENKQETKVEEVETQETASEVEQPKVEEVDYKAKFFYVAAEMENLRKRFDREKDQLLKYGQEKILSDMIEVMDNFERTVEMLKFDEDQKVKNIVFGLDMVKKIFTDAMSKHGLVALESVGKDFDPNFHEAMTQEYVEGKRPNEIIKEFQRGYTLNGRLIRAAKVVVASDKQ
jgi:molecular chaperone GrpE